MLEFEQQLHGYHQGHQLLDSTVKLQRRDQDLIDRLSDIAGPLRPGEKFDPYLTCYPLPSGSYYVIARTWQDLAAPRAGCVITRSAIIPMSGWLENKEILEVVDFISRLGPPIPAGTLVPTRSLPLIDVSEVMELTEALFLERRVPIVVFDSPTSEAISLRILLGTWPSFRRGFSLSTFALSPRLLEGKSFDLVFAPITAKARFSDWVGRRIDARARAKPRHRWTILIASRLFTGDGTLLEGSNVFDEISSNIEADESVLRLSLLWDELYEKLGVNSNAALGLLDIANSRPNSDLRVIQRLIPSLVLATERAVAELPPKEAWRFLAAISEKMAVSGSLRLMQSDIESAAQHLAESAPQISIEASSALSGSAAHRILLTACAKGLARCFSDEIVSVLSTVDERSFLALLLSNRCLAAKSAASPALQDLLWRSISGASAHEVQQCIGMLLPLLVEEKQSEVASLLISSLSHSELLQEVLLLSETNGLSLTSLNRSILKRAGELGACGALRDLLASLPQTPGADDMLLDLLHPTPDDLAWIRRSFDGRGSRACHLVLKVLRNANNVAFDKIISAQEWNCILPLLLQNPVESRDVLKAALLRNWLNPTDKVDVIARLLPLMAKAADREVLADWMQILLECGKHPRREAVINDVLRKSEGDISAHWLIKSALGRRIRPPEFDANLLMLSSSPLLRGKISSHIGLVAQAIASRGTVDFEVSTAEAVGALLWECASNDELDIEAYARLMRFLMWQPNAAASPVLAAIFPAVYMTLGQVNKESGSTGILRMFDFDRRKSMRNEIVDAFLRGNWRPIDLGLAAARAGDSMRILGRLTKQRAGKRVLAQMKTELAKIPKPWRADVAKTLNEFGI